MSTPATPIAGNRPQMDVAHVARLARLRLTPEEITRFEGQLNDILGYVSQLRAQDVTGVEPTAHARPLANVFREDEPAPGLDRDRVLEQAPAARHGLFILPRIIE